MSATESPLAPSCQPALDSCGVSLQVVALEPGSEARWDSFVLAHPGATFFHLTGWLKVMSETYGFKPCYFYAERGGQITGIAPAFLISSWLTGKCLISLPFAVYGGVCASDPESEAALVDHLERVAIEERVQYLELRNRDGLLSPGFASNSRYATFTIPLVPETDALYKAFPKDIRYMIRKGEKAGLKARRGLDQLETFYRLLTVNLRRLGTPAFPFCLFENLIRAYPGQVDIIVVYAGEKAVAAGMTFFFREWMQPYYVGALDEAKPLAANNFLWWEFIKLGASTGHTVFDFGRSKMDSGNFDFKKKWNPKIECLNYQVRLVTRKDMPNFSPVNPKFKLATACWKKMPLPLTRIIGPKIVRWFP